MKVRTLKAKPLATSFRKQRTSAKPLPIYLTESHRTYSKDWDINYPSWKGVYHYQSKEAKEKVPKAYQEIRATMHEYPSIQRDIEESKPEAVIFSSTSKPEQEEEGWAYHQKIFVRPPPSCYLPKSSVIRGIQQKAPKSEQQEAITYNVERTPFPKEETKRTVNRKRRRAIAEHIHHELTHTKQERKLGNKAMSKMEKDYGYYNAPFEKEARITADQKIRNAIYTPIDITGRMKMKDFWNVKGKRSRRTHFTLDTDNDKVPDYKDCNPFNPRKHYYGPSEFKVENEEELEKLYWKIKKNATSRYNNKKEAKEVGEEVANIKLREKYYEPEGEWDLKGRNKPVLSFETKMYVHQKIPTTVMVVYDRFKNVLLYVDVGTKIHQYSAIHLNERYTKGWGGERCKTFFAITEEDLQKVGNDFPMLIQYAFEFHYNDFLKVKHKKPKQPKEKTEQKRLNIEDY